MLRSVCPWTLWGREKSRLLPRLRPQFPGHPACSLVTIILSEQWCHKSYVKLGPDWHLPHPLQFIIYKSSYHLANKINSHQKIPKITMYYVRTHTKGCSTQVPRDHLLHSDSQDTVQICIKFQRVRTIMETKLRVSKMYGCKQEFPVTFQWKLLNQI